jgi:hypothetical protein
MIYCLKHDLFFNGKTCPKCSRREQPTIRVLDKIADPEERRIIRKKGWGR